MIIPYDEVVPNPEPKAIPVEDNIDQKVYINKFNNKPFGKVFLKLIALDKKVAEFSATQFSKLKNTNYSILQSFYRTMGLNLLIIIS